jgi:hypothetical protein
LQEFVKLINIEIKQRGEFVMIEKSSSLRKLAMQAKKRLNGASKEKQSCPKKDLSTMTIYKNLYKNISYFSS